MSVEVTLHLPEHLVEHAKRFGEATQRDVGQVLADTLEVLWATIGTGPELEPPVSTLTDEDVLALADAKMDPVQNDRLAELQRRGKADGLTEAERNELPRSKLRGIKPPLAYSYGPPVWRGRARVACVCSACEP